MWIFDEGIGEGGNMHQTILMDTDIHKSAKGGNVGDDAFQHHAGNQIF